MIDALIDVFKNAINEKLIDALICILKISIDDELINAIKDELIDAFDVIKARDMIERWANKTREMIERRADLRKNDEKIAKRRNLLHWSIFHVRQLSRLHQSLFRWCHENDIKRRRIDWLSDHVWNYFEFSEINVALTNDSSQLCTFCAATKVIFHSA